MYHTSLYFGDNFGLVALFMIITQDFKLTGVTDKTAFQLS